MNSFSLLTDNLIPWMIHVSVLAALGAVLPQLFRIRHPKTQLAFSHFVLMLCILLPLLEPWQHPLRLPGGIVHDPMGIRTGFVWITYLEWVIVAGIVAKMCWLAGGLWQIRRYRSSATRLFPTPASVREARILTRADARIGISRNVDGPATFGYRDPIILLPETFLALNYEAQLSIVCHELLHVKRNDWLVTLFEEVAGAIFWFNPAVWMLLSQTKLSREQFVDAEVVERTAAPASYVQALLVMAGAPGKASALPAAFFLTGGHLSQRIRSLLTKRSGSVVRLAGSYALIACLLVVFTVVVSAWFPLIGETYTLETTERKHLLPPTLIARTALFSIAENSSAVFNVRVPAPRAESESGDVVYHVAGVVSDTADEGKTTFLQAPLPLPPSLQLFRISGEPGVRVFHPGEVATPEDIARMQAAFGERARIEIMQAEDGVVQRVTILRRRSPDESGIGYFMFGIGADGVISAGSTAPADSAGAADSVH